MSKIDFCLLCMMDETAIDFVAEWTCWKLIVNHNQNYLGKVMLVLKRHATEVTQLTNKEQTEFWFALSETQAALMDAFRPAHFNYAFLKNQDAHVHLHIIPRYAESREFAGHTFSDGHLGAHYALTARIVTPELRQIIAKLLQTKGLNH